MDSKVNLNNLKLCKAKVRSIKETIHVEGIIDNETGNEINFYEKLSDFFSSWTAHGPVHITQNTSLFLKIWWIAICTGMTMFCIQQCYGVTAKFFSDNKIILLDMYEDTEITFPSVTLCSLSPFSLSKKSKNNESMYGQFDKLMEIFNKFTNTTVSVTHEKYIIDEIETDCYLARLENMERLNIATHLGLLPEDKSIVDNTESVETEDARAELIIQQFEDLMAKPRDHALRFIKGLRRQLHVFKKKRNNSQTVVKVIYEIIMLIKVKWNLYYDRGSALIILTCLLDLISAKGNDPFLIYMILETRKEIKNSEENSFDSDLHVGKSKKEDSKLNLNKRIMGPNRMKRRLSCSDTLRELLRRYLITSQYSAEYILSALDLECKEENFVEEQLIDYVCGFPVIEDSFGIYNMDFLECKTNITYIGLLNNYNFTCSSCCETNYWLIQNVNTIDRIFPEDESITCIDNKIIENEFKPKNRDDDLKRIFLYLRNDEYLLYEFASHMMLDTSNLLADKRDFISNCNFNGYPCSYKDFKQWISDKNGFCYSFNPSTLKIGETSPQFTKNIHVENVGSKYGLQVTLNLHKNELLPFVSRDLGLKIILHEPGTIPFPEEEALDIPPDDFSNIEFTMINRLRHKPPYGLCEDIILSKKYEYTQTMCRKMCEEEYIRYKCKCKVGLSPVYKDILGNVLKLPYCPFHKDFTHLNRSCVEEAKRKLSLKADYCHCPPKCSEWEYETKLYNSLVNTEYNSFSQYASGTMVGNDICGRRRGETSRINIYISKLEHSQVNENPVYTYEAWLSYIAGNLGLCMGISIISILELISFIIEIIVNRIKKNSKQERKIGRRKKIPIYFALKKATNISERYKDILIKSNEDYESRLGKLYLVKIEKSSNTHENNKDKPVSEVKERTNDFFSSWTAHGPVHLVSNMNYKIKFVWVIICMAVFGTCCVLCYALLNDFLSLNKITAFDIISPNEILFPAVTICSLGSIVFQKRYDPLDVNNDVRRSMEALRYTTEEAGQYYTDIFHLGQIQGNLVTCFGSVYDILDKHKDVSIKYVEESSISSNYSNETKQDAYTLIITDNEKTNLKKLEEYMENLGEISYRFSVTDEKYIAMQNIIEKLIDMNKNGILSINSAKPMIYYIINQMQYYYKKTGNFDKIIPYTLDDIFQHIFQIEANYLDESRSYDVYTNTSESDRVRMQCSKVYSKLLRKNCLLNKNGSCELLEKIKSSGNQCSADLFKETVILDKTCSTTIVSDSFGVYNENLDECDPSVNVSSEQLLDVKQYSCSSCCNSTYDINEKNHISMKMPKLRENLSCKQGYSQSLAQKVTKLFGSSQSPESQYVLRILSRSKGNVDAFKVDDKEFISKCRFNKGLCSIRDFKKWLSNEHGYCYTFNSKTTMENVFFTSESGVNSGLMVAININGQDVMQVSTNEIGAKIILHDPTTIPFPAYEGFNIMPGFTSHINVSLKKKIKLPPPIGNCKDINDFSRHGYTYTKMLCRQICLEEKIRNDCGCRRGLSPAFDIIETNSNMTYCDPFDIVTSMCIADTILFFQNENLCECPPPCSEWEFSYTVSTSKPNEDFSKHFQKHANVRNSEEICTGSNLTTANVHIFMGKKEYEEFEDLPSYTWEYFLSTIGGSVGVFFGFSLISLFELFEFLGYLFITICFSRSKRTLNNDLDVFVSIQQ